jgi:hypothetical protein
MIRVHVWCMHPITPLQYLKPYQLWSQPADTLRQPSSQFQQSRWTTLSSFPGKPWLMSINPISLGSSLILVQHLFGTPFSPCEVPHASVSDTMSERVCEGEKLCGQRKGHSLKCRKGCPGFHNHLLGVPRRAEARGALGHSHSCPSSAVARVRRLDSCDRSRPRQCGV